MARIAGVNIPTNKRVEIALTYIHGIGPTTARNITEQAGVPLERRVNELTDAEVTQIREIIDRNYARAKKILEDNLDKLHAMAEALLKYETIDSKQIARIMRGEDPGEPEHWQDGQDRTPPGGPNAPATPKPEGAPDGGVAHPVS